MSKQKQTQIDLLDNNHKFLLNDTYHTLEWIRNENRPEGKEFYLIPMYSERALSYALNANDIKTYKELIGEELTKEFIETLPRSASKELAY